MNSFKVGDLVFPIRLAEDNMHSDFGTVMHDWSGDPAEMIKVHHESGKIRWHLASQLKLVLKDWTNSECSNCQNPNTAYIDADGVWLECACSAGYIF